MARKLNVHLNGALAGELEQDDSGALWFQYGDAWLGSPSATPLSASLPLRRERFNRNECRPFFAGVLPEEESRRRIAKAFGVSDKNDFALLERIGAECAGAVSLLRPGEPAVPSPGRYREITREELAVRFSELPRHPLLAGEAGVRLSLAGAQGKLAVKISDGRFFLPLDGSPSSHILKPQNSHFESLPENEFFCMQLAGRVGLQVAAVELGRAGGITFLQVERFDRKRLPNGELSRIHQEDFCQASGVAPEMKYQQEGGPNLKKCFELIRSVSTVPAPDLLRLFDAVIFNFLIGNCDAHGKNFSFLYEPGAATLAPLYDLVCTRAYPTLAAEMAMKIGGQRDPVRLTTRNWRAFFDETGLGHSTAGRRLRAIAGRLLQEAGAMAEMPGAERVLPIVVENCQRFR